MLSISVIIPTFKPQESYLRTCLESLVHQTLSSKCYEVIVVLNGCDGSYLEIVKSIVTGYNVFTIIHTNLPGVSNARNLGLDAAKGEFVTFMDDDDYVSEVYLERLLEYASKNTITISNAMAFNDETKEIITSYPLSLLYQRYSLKKEHRFATIRGFFSGPWMKLIHRDVIGNRRFNTHYSNGEDVLFMFLISNQFKYVNFTSSDAIYYRRYRQGSAISKLQSKQFVLRNSLSLMKDYTKILLSGAGYSFLFYFTRMLAAIHTYLRVLKQ